MLGDDFGDDDSLRKAFHVALHIGTLVGAIAYFKDDIKRYVQAALLDPKSADGRMGWYIGLSALPTAVVGALLSGVIESGGSRQIWLIAVMLIVGIYFLTRGEEPPATTGPVSGSFSRISHSSVTNRPVLVPP